MRSHHRFGAVPLAGLLLLACGSGDPTRPDGSGDPTPPDSGADALGVDSGASACQQVVGGPFSGQHVLRFENAGAAARVHLQRRYVQVGVGESVIYALEAMWIERAGDCVSILDAEKLAYTNSHHNWRDRAAGSAGGIDYQLTLHKEIPVQRWFIQLSGTRDGAAAFAPLDLVTTGGPIGLSETPAQLPVMITELMADNRSGWRDEAGETAPWIELWNPSAEAVDLSGWALSDDPGRRRRWVFPAGTTIGRHQTLVVAADGQTAQGPLHASFALVPGAGSVVLTNPAGLTAGERSYPAVAADHSVRFSYSIDGFEPSPTATPGDVAVP